MRARRRSGISGSGLVLVNQGRPTGASGRGSGLRDPYRDSRTTGSRQRQSSHAQLRFSQVLRQAVQIVLGVERCHAARAGGGDRLPVDVILDVAAGEHAGDARSRAGVRARVAVRRPSRADRGRAPCSACGRWPRTGPRRDLLQLVRSGCSEARSGDLALPLSCTVSTSLFHSKRDLRVRERLVLHDLRRAQRIAPVDQRDVRGEARQEDGLFQRRVSAADDRDRLAAEEVTVARRAGGDAMADEGSLGRQPEQPAEAPVAMIRPRVLVLRFRGRDRRTDAGSDRRR